MKMNPYETDVLIIGAGQAGLALAYALKSTTLRYLVVERNNSIGDSWRKRYDSLTLFTPRFVSQLPGLKLEGDPQGYASRDEFANYLEDYAQHYRIPIYLGHEVQRLERTPNGFLALTKTGDQLSCRIVVLATGPFQKPKVPSLASQFSPEVVQFTPESYRNPTQIPDGTVLVVGDGATGRDIANELSITHSVLLATGRPRRLLPEQLLGKSIWWWLVQMGITTISAKTALGQYMRRTDPFPARGKRFRQLRQNGVEIMKSLKNVSGATVIFVDGIHRQIKTVIWATGYRDESDWVAIPEVKDGAGNFIHNEGISPVEGLYFIGRSWQRSRGSALVAGVGDDASFIADTIAQHWATIYERTSNSRTDLVF
jgi:putative flavoprotein involved in K+ transport